MQLMEMESEPAGGKRVLHKGIVQPSSLQSLIHDTCRPIDESMRRTSSPSGAAFRNRGPTEWERDGA